MNDKALKYITQKIDSHAELVAKLKTNSLADIAAIANLITDSIKKGGCVYICGNGGSAADAQHIAGELVGRFEKERSALPAIALSTDTSVMTSVANDYGYQDIFVRQTSGLVKKGDVFWGISTSGTSANIIAAAEIAKQKGAQIIAFTGKTDSPLEKMADASLCANTDSAAQAQQIHQIAYHIICGLVEMDFDQ